MSFTPLHNCLTIIFPRNYKSKNKMDEGTMVKL